MDSKIYKYTLLWKYLEILPQLKVDTKISLSQSIIHCALHSFYFYFIFFSFLFLFLLVCWSNGLHTTLLSSCCCVWPKSRGLGHRQAPSLWKHLCCWWVRKKKKKKTKGHAIPSLLTQATGSLHPGRKKHVVAGNTLEQSLLIYSLSNKGPTILQGLEGQDGLADVRSVFGPRGNSFMHSLTHSFICNV